MTPGRPLRVLYAGDSPVGGPANYLLGVLRFLKAFVCHLPPAARLRPQLLGRRYDAIILSDFPARHAPTAGQRAIVRQVIDGAGLLMIGGWASFAGPDGGWRGSDVERLLPVTCRGRDDRLHLSGGALVLPAAEHPLVRSVPFTRPPVICGMNRVRAKRRSLLLLGAREIRSRCQRAGGSFRVALHPVSHPLLVVDADPRRRVAAFATDLAPHWCAGLVDWGTRRVTLPVTPGVSVEVGNHYLNLVSALIRWLAVRR